MKNKIIVFFVMIGFCVNSYADHKKPTIDMLRDIYVKVADETAVRLWIDNNIKRTASFALNMAKDATYCSPSYAIYDTDYSNINSKTTYRVIVKEISFSDIDRIEIVNKDPQHIILYTKNNQKIINCEGRCEKKMNKLTVVVPKNENLHMVKEDFGKLIELCKKRH